MGLREKKEGAKEREKSRDRKLRELVKGGYSLRRKKTE